MDLFQDIMRPVSENVTGFIIIDIPGYVCIINKIVSRTVAINE